MTHGVSDGRRNALYDAHFRRRVHSTEQALAEAGYDRLLVHSGRARNRFQDDVHPPFRAHPHFVSWLPLPRHEDALLEIRVGHKPRLWLVVPDDYWHAPPEGSEDWWAEAFEIEVVSTPRAWRPRLADPVATALIGDPADFTTLDGHADLNPPGLLALLDEARTVKSEWEIETIAEANRRAIAGHNAAREAFEAGASELEIHLAYLRAARQDPDHLPYNSIVALNEHAAVLHYQRREIDPPAQRHAFLIDAGADVDGLAADITRTCAARRGPFADLIEALDALQQRLAERARAGQSFVELHLDTHRGIATILRDAALCRMSIDAMLEAGVTRAFFPHGLGHFLGVQVHDVAGRTAPDGRPLPPPDDHPFLRLTRVLEAGNVITIEPGLYFIPSLLGPLRDGPLAAQFDWTAIDALARCGGIRIEDNVVVAMDRPRNLTREAESA